MANSIEIKIDLPNEKFTVGDVDALTGALTVTITAPDGLASVATTVADGGTTDFLFNSVVGWTNSLNALQRGLWTFAYTDTTPVTPISGSVTFDSTFLSSNIIETIDGSGNAITRDSVLLSNIDMSMDCFTSELSISDNTSYILGGITGSFACSACTVFSNTVYSPPNVAPQTNVISTPSIIGSTITPVYTGTYTSYVTGTGKWTWDETTTYVTESNSYDSDVHVYSEIDGGNQIAVDCSTTALCDVWECIRDINQKYKDASCVNTKEADKYKSKLERAMQLATLAEQAVACGESTLMATYIDEIKTVTNCKTC